MFLFLYLKIKIHYLKIKSNVNGAGGRNDSTLLYSVERKRQQDAETADERTTNCSIRNRGGMVWWMRG